MDIGPGAAFRKLMREDYWEAMHDPWTLEDHHILRDWERVVCFLMVKRNRKAPNFGLAQTTGFMKSVSAKLDNVRT